MFLLDSPIGVDEAGRGPWAGPVVAAAACFSREFRELGVFRTLRDSKALPARARERIEREASALRGTCLEYALGVATNAEIDSLNIRMATRLAMDRAIAGLLSRLGSPDGVVFACRIDGRDGFVFPDRAVAAEYAVRGDSIHPEIMLASVLAKVARDRMMTEFESEYPGYGFARHK